MSSVTSQTSHPGILSDREHEVLTFVAAGLRNQDVARELSISEATVENHLHHIFEKLGVSNRVQAALYVIQSSKPDLDRDEGNPS